MPRIGTSTALFWLGFQPFFNGVQSFSIIFICFLGEGISFQVLFCFCFFFLGLFFFFFLVYCLASLAVWWLPWLFGFRSVQGASVAVGHGLCGFASVASSCIRVQVSRGPEYGSKASEKTRGEQEAICNLGSDQLFAVDTSTTFFLGEALRPPPNPSRFLLFFKTCPPDS